MPRQHIVASNFMLDVSLTSHLSVCAQKGVMLYTYIILTWTVVQHLDKLCEIVMETDTGFGSLD